MEEFQTIFDVERAGFSNWGGLAIGLFFIFIGTVLVFRPRTAERYVSDQIDLRTGWPRILSIFIFLFAVFWTGLLVFSISRNQQKLRALLESGHYRTVEGPIYDMWMGAKSESFSVQGVSFKYSQFFHTGAFNGGYIFGSPIHNGTYVRVAYSGDMILRLEVKKRP